MIPISSTDDSAPEYVVETLQSECALREIKLKVEVAQDTRELNKRYEVSKKISQMYDQLLSPHIQMTELVNDIYKFVELNR